MMDTYLSLLQTYSGRDKIVRTTGYVSVLLTGVVKGKTGQKLAIFAKQLSSARTILRLFDDIPMWNFTRKWAASEEDRLSRICSILGNIASQVYYPCEHIAWGADRELWTIDSFNWWGAGTLCWALSLFFNILRGIRQLFVLRQKRAKLIVQKRLESLEEIDESGSSTKTSIQQCLEKEIDEYWNLLKNISDFILAVNILPWKGILWSGKFGTVKNASFGTISSLVGLYLIIKAQRKKK